MFNKSARDTGVIRTSVMAVFRPVCGVIFRRRPQAYRFQARKEQAIQCFFGRPLFICYTATSCFKVGAHCFLTILVRIVVGKSGSMLCARAVLFLWVVVVLRVSAFRPGRLVVCLLSNISINISASISMLAQPTRQRPILLFPM